MAGQSLTEVKSPSPVGEPDIAGINPDLIRSPPGGGALNTARHQPTGVRNHSCNLYPARYIPVTSGNTFHQETCTKLCYWNPPIKIYGTGKIRLNPIHGILFETAESVRRSLAPCNEVKDPTHCLRTKRGRRTPDSVCGSAHHKPTDCVSSPTRVRYPSLGGEPDVAGHRPTEVRNPLPSGEPNMAGLKPTVVRNPIGSGEPNTARHHPFTKMRNPLGSGEPHLDGESFIAQNGNLLHLWAGTRQGNGNRLFVEKADWEDFLCHDVIMPISGMLAESTGAFLLKPLHKKSSNVCRAYTKTSLRRDKVSEWIFHVIANISCTCLWVKCCKLFADWKSTRWKAAWLKGDRHNSMLWELPLATMQDRDKK